VRVFVDTSALLSILDQSEQNHSRASSAWQRLIQADEILVTSSYVLIETVSLVQARRGLAIVRRFEEEVLPALQLQWLDADDHRRAMSALLAAGRRQLSLVDCASFDTMRRLGIRTAFTFDPHFAEQGFTVVP
jgi:predicted nucleic acid-binding protein